MDLGALIVGLVIGVALIAGTMLAFSRTKTTTISRDDAGRVIDVTTVRGIG